VDDLALLEYREFGEIVSPDGPEQSLPGLSNKLTP
jgi:hypothetical protein